MLQKRANTKPHGCSVFTSNVDGQFQAAGFDPPLVYECQGSIHHMQCGVPCSEAIWRANGLLPVTDDAISVW